MLISLKITIKVANESECDDKKDRGQWSKGLEFLLSCISMSVGLGNVCTMCIAHPYKSLNKN